MSKLTTLDASRSPEQNELEWVRATAMDILDSDSLSIVGMVCNIMRCEDPPRLAASWRSYLQGVFDRCTENRISFQHLMAISVCQFSYGNVHEQSLDVLTECHLGAWIKNQADSSAKFQRAEFAEKKIACLPWNLIWIDDVSDETGCGLVESAVKFFDLLENSNQSSDEVTA